MAAVSVKRSIIVVKKKCTYIWDGSNATNQDSVFPHLAVGLRLMDAPNSLVA